MEDVTNYDLVQEERPVGNYKPPKNKGPKLVIWALIFSLLGGCIGGAFSWYFLSNKTHVANNGEKISIETNEDLGQVEAVAKKAMPSVVGITTKAIQMTMFGPMPVEGSGSGFIVTDDGYILSNAHVVGEKNQKVNVLLDDGEQAEGKVVWSDATLDLGLVKIDKKGLPTMELGDSENLNIGELAVAIGNPLGLDFQRTVTSGVISGLNRNIGEVEGNYMDGLIQTDASINSGNSGGPLLNKEGKVIGINTVKISSAEGIGFSIPINSVKPIIDQVIKTGDYKTVSLGIAPVSVSAVERKNGMNIGTDGNGVVVMKVEEDSPAAKAGLKTYDIILEFDGKIIKNTEQLRRDLYKYKEGDQIEVTIIRNGKKSKINVEFTDYKLQETGNPTGIVPYREE